MYCAALKPIAPHALAALPPLPDGGAPRAVDLNKDVALIVADVDAGKFRSTAIEAGLSDLDWVSRCGSAHHAVADALVPKHTVVPFRMFTIFESEAGAQKTLTAATRGITRALARVRNKSEWVLRIGVPDPGRASGQGAQPTTVSTTSGTSFLAQKAAAKRAASARATRVRHEAQEVFDRVSKLASASDRRPPDASAGFLLDAAFLVGARQLPAFKRELAKAARGLLGDGCKVSLTGPWPPYSFVDLTEKAARD